MSDLKQIYEPSRENNNILELTTTLTYFFKFFLAICYIKIIYYDCNNSIRVYG